MNSSLITNLFYHSASSSAKVIKSKFIAHKTNNWLLTCFPHGCQIALNQAFGRLSCELMAPHLSGESL